MDPRTRNELQVWASGKELVFASFFFWNAGTNMQKSQEGLLRTIMYEILRQHPTLIPMLFPDHWRRAENLGVDVSGDPPITCSDIEAAFGRLKNDEVSTAYRFCFFIDGLDEFAGDHRKLVKLLKNWTQSACVKICLSSRPWNVFEYSFPSGRKLRLQDLTRHDIELYVRDELESDDDFARLKDEDVRYQHLVTKIVDKADGVFLWVYLVVRELRNGLQNDDRIFDLELRLETLPSGLVPFFNHILQSIDPVYREQTARMFSIATMAPKPLGMLTYSFLDDIEDEPAFALKAPVRPYTEREVQERYERTRRRLDGRCKGLLEVNEDSSADSFFKYRVDFLHRTVREFLETDEIQEELGNRVNQFHAERSLSHACLAQIKFVPTKGEHFIKYGPLYHLVDDLAFWARQMEIKAHNPRDNPMVALEHVLHRHRRLPFSHPDERLENPGWIAWNPSQEIFDGEHFSLVDFAAYHGLLRYISWKLNKCPDLLHEDRTLVLSALGCIGHVSQYTFRPNPRLVQLILERGVRPNQGHIWTKYIQSFDRTAHHGALSAEESQIIETFLKFGADPTVSISTFKPDVDEDIHEVGSQSRRPMSLREFIDITLPDNADTLRQLLQQNQRYGPPSWMSNIAGNTVLPLITGMTCWTP